MLSPSALSLGALFLLPSIASAITFDCQHFIVDGHSYNFEKLGGAHTVHWVREEPPSINDFAFTVDLCKNIPREKGVAKEEQCPTGTRICGIDTFNNTVSHGQMISKVVPIAGNYETSHGRGLDPKYERLKGSSSHSDAERDGVRIEFGGGRYPDSSKGMDQKAIIEFECDPERTGLEGLEDMENRDVTVNKEGDKEGEEDGDDHEKEKNKSSLQFVSYKKEGNEGDETSVLRLSWKTKYACEAAAAPDGDKKEKGEDGDKPKKAGMGWFAWLLIM